MVLVGSHRFSVVLSSCRMLSVVLYGYHGFSVVLADFQWLSVVLPVSSCRFSMVLVGPQWFS